MAKRSKGPGSIKVSFRLSGSLWERVRDVVHSTGWSDTHAASFLLSLGVQALHRQAEGIAGARTSYERAVGIHAAEVKAAELVRAAKAKFRGSPAPRVTTRDRALTAKAADVLAAGGAS